MFDYVDKVIDGVKKVREMAQKAHDAELLNAIADLMLNAGELKIALANLREENARLRDEFNDQKTRADLRSKVEIRKGFYFLTQAMPGYGNGPFCPVCFDRDGKLISLKTLFKPSGLSGITVPAGWQCGACQNKFYVTE